MTLPVLQETDIISQLGHWNQRCRQAKGSDLLVPWRVSSYRWSPACTSPFLAFCWFSPDKSRTFTYRHVVCCAAPSGPGEKSPTERGSLDYHRLKLVPAIVGDMWWFPGESTKMCRWIPRMVTESLWQRDPLWIQSTSKPQAQSQTTNLPLVTECGTKKNI